MNELVERAKHKDSEAYSMLIKDVEADLMKMAIKKIKNYHDAQDIVQDTLYTAYLSLNKLEDNDKFKPWIIGILKNKCKKFYEKRKSIDEITEEIVDKTDYKIEDKVDFDSIMDKLDEKEREIFRLYFEDDLSTKEISKRLHINENTLKTILRRGKGKLERKGIKRFTIFIWILCIFVATSVIAISIINYIMGLFDTTSKGVYNEGILEAIESSEWFQQVDMDYIDLGDGYKLRVEYLLMDEMNLYMVYELQSENDIGKYDDISIPDLKIVDENGNVICDKVNISVEQYSKKTATKPIEGDKHSIKELTYMFTDSFPKSRTLHISFSKVMLTGKSMFGNNKYEELAKNVEFEINLDEKFITRNYVEYTCDNEDVEKAIVTETGFYAIVNTENTEIIEATLIDESKNELKCFSAPLNNNNTTKDMRSIIIVNYKEFTNNKFKLKVDGKEYELRKKIKKY